MNEETFPPISEQPSPTPAPEPHSVFFGPEGLRAGWSLLLYIVLLATFFFGAQFLSHLVHHAHRVVNAPVESSGISPLAAIISEGAPFLVIALATWIMSKIERRPVGVYGLGDTRKLPRFFAGLGWGIVFLSALVLTLKITGLLVFDHRLLFGTSILRYGALWLLGFLFVGLLEEYLLRGYLQFTLARGLSSIYDALNAPHQQAFGFWTAAFLLSFLFGFSHGSNPGESPIGLFAAGVAGFVFCFSLWRTGSLWWAIGFHVSWDWAQSFLYGVADSGLMIKFHLVSTHPVGKPILSGGATGPEGSIFILPIMVLIALVILFTLPATRHEHGYHSALID